MRALSTFATILLLTAIAIAQRLPVLMEVRPLFGTTVPPFGCLPLKISLQNEGPSVQTTLSVVPLGAGRTHLFPLTLPSGSRKEILALPFVLHDTMSVEIGLTEVRPPIKQTLPVTPSEYARLVVGIGDEIGGLEFLRALNPKPTTQPAHLRAYTLEWVWAYCRPEDFPDKAAALTGVSVLVLGSGAERLTPSQWQAIRRWVGMGGVIVASGGSAAIYLRHVALASILPVQNLRTEQWSDWRPLARWLNIAPPSEPAFITVGNPTSYAQILVVAPNLSLLIAIRYYGCGSVIFIAFNLWDKPFRGWKGLPGLWRKAVEPFIIQPVANLWGGTLLALGGRWEGYQAAWYSSSYYPSPSSHLQQFPLQIELPSAFSLTVTLLIYFAIAVPFSYFMLRRYRRMDWQWLIAPFLALAFVFVVGWSAFGLYRLGDQNVTQGVVIAATGERDAYLLASTTLFLQRAGDYILNLGNSEAVFSQVRREGFASGIPLRTLDGTTVTAQLSVPNLSFQLFYFAKPITLKGNVEMKAKRKGNEIIVSVTNRLPFTLRSVSCALSSMMRVWSREMGWSEAPYATTEAETRLPDLEPGQSEQTRLSLLSRRGQPSPPLPPGVPAPQPISPRLTHWVTLMAQIDGMDIAPHLNVPTQRKSFVTLKVVCPAR